MMLTKVLSLCVFAIISWCCFSEEKERNRVRGGVEDQEKNEIGANDGQSGARDSAYLQTDFPDLRLGY